MGLGSKTKKGIRIVFWGFGFAWALEFHGVLGWHRGLVLGDVRGLRFQCLEGRFREEGFTFRAFSPVTRCLQQFFLGSCIVAESIAPQIGKRGV